MSKLTTKLNGNKAYLRVYYNKYELGYTIWVNGKLFDVQNFDGDVIHSAKTKASAKHYIMNNLITDDLEY